MLYAFAKNKTEITNAQKQKIAEANYIYINAVVHINNFTWHRVLVIYNSLRAHMSSVEHLKLRKKKREKRKEEAHLYISNKWTHSHPSFFFLLRERPFLPSLYVFIIGTLCRSKRAYLSRVPLFVINQRQIVHLSQNSWFRDVTSDNKHLQYHYK